MTSNRYPLVIIGAGGFGREALDVAEAMIANGDTGIARIEGVVDDHPSAQNLERLRARNVAYLGKLEGWLAKQPSVAYVIAVGNPGVRKRIRGLLSGFGCEFATLVHPHAQLGSRVSVGVGTVICAGSLISTNVAVGSHNHINPGSIVGHDSELQDFVSTNPGAVISGDVYVEAGTLVGAGAKVLQGLRVGRSVTIGAGAVVVGNVSDTSTVKGVPAR